jgi:hypothetical protein
LSPETATSSHLPISLPAQRAKSEPGGIFEGTAEVGDIQEERR